MDNLIGTPDLLLANFAKHVELTETEQAILLSLMEPRTFARKELLLSQGEICRAETFILKGCVRMFSTDANGVEHTQLFGTEDWWVGDLYSFLTGTPSIYTIAALEETHVLQITPPDLEKLYTQVPKAERFFRIIIQNAFIAQQQRIDQNLALTGEERYLRFTEKFPQLEQRVPQKQIASYLGITPEFLSMIRRKIAYRKS
jgi:CRP-like cAMP-binding protein